MVLFDDILEDAPTKGVTKVNINGVEFTGWVVAKPINPRGLTTRLKEAITILKGKGVAIQYFDDLKQKEKEIYVLKELELLNNQNNNNGLETK